MKPYYEHAGITIYHGDAREILPTLDVRVCITDPVWPNAHPALVGADRPQALWSEILAAMPDITRLVCILGCQSDPRFLLPVPTRLQFLRVAYLRRAVPSYNGRCLVSGDVLYAFGSWPSARPGRHVLPGEWSVTSKHRERKSHPCARNQDHMEWVVKHWTDFEDTVVDPYAGTGSTLRACMNHGIKAIGIEIEERYCEIAVRRLAQGVLEFPEVRE